MVFKIVKYNTDMMMCHLPLYIYLVGANRIITNKVQVLPRRSQNPFTSYFTNIKLKNTIKEDIKDIIPEEESYTIGDSFSGSDIASKTVVMLGYGVVMWSILAYLLNTYTNKSIESYMSSELKRADKYKEVL
jgi:hypothetical protein